MVTAVVVGGGPAGLMAAEALSQGGVSVAVYDAMPSVGRKFLMAGKGGLNLTHAEPTPRFLTRYGTRQDVMTAMLTAFGAEHLQAWSHTLGIETFVGTSQRVFPREMKAAPLLRAWIRRLKAAGVSFHMRHRWTGWNGAALRFETPDGTATVKGDAVVLALGGGSWPKLGSDGTWVPTLREEKIDVADLQPANCGFDVAWTEHMRERFAGAPVKPVSATFGGRSQQGEFIVTSRGVEGGLIYAFSAALRDEITAKGSATLLLDLAPKKTLADLMRSRGKASLATHLKKIASIDGVRAALLREAASIDELAGTAQLAQLIKALPIVLKAPRPIAEVISSAGGVRFETLDASLMAKSKPGVFCAGEMLDWEAPTGGYLLTGCFATGHAAGHGALRWLKR